VATEPTKRQMAGYAVGPVPIVLAVDIGGTKTAVAAVNVHGDIGRRWRWPTDESPDAWLDRLVAIMSEFHGPLDRPRAIGVAVPAVLDDARERVLWAPNLPGWKNFPLADMLRQRMVLPVVMDLDGHMGAAGEHWQGALKGIDDCVFIVVGTGIGGGIVIQGRVHHGRHDLSGCLGWMVVGDRDGVPERAGSVGWLESQAGGSTLQELAGTLGYGRAPQPVEELVAAAAAGDAGATAVLVRAGQLIGRAVANVVNLLSPKAVALGGTVILGTPIVLAEVRKTVAVYAHPYLRSGLVIVEAATGADAPLLGAARLAIDLTEASSTGPFGTS
jgi:glucokinase